MKLSKYSLLIILISFLLSLFFFVQIYLYNKFPDWQFSNHKDEDSSLIVEDSNYSLYYHERKKTLAEVLFKTILDKKYNEYCYISFDKSSSEKIAIKGFSEAGRDCLRVLKSNTNVIYDEISYSDQSKSWVKTNKINVYFINEKKPLEIINLVDEEALIYLVNQAGDSLVLVSDKSIYTFNLTSKKVNLMDKKDLTTVFPISEEALSLLPFSFKKIETSDLSQPIIDSTFTYVLEEKNYTYKFNLNKNNGTIKLEFEQNNDRI